MVYRRRNIRQLTVNRGGFRCLVLGARTVLPQARNCAPNRDERQCHPRQQTAAIKARHDERGEVRHLRLVARHRVRMVRLLSLRDAGAVLRRAVLSAGQRHGGLAVGIRDLRRGLPGPSVRRAHLRTHRRPGRPQVHLPGHHHGDGHRRPSLVGLLPTFASDRLARADPAGDAASAAGPRARRRIRRCGDLRRRARAGRTSAAMPRAGSRPRRRSASSWRSSSSALCRAYMDAKVFADWGWRIPFLVSVDPADLLGLHPAQAERDRRSSRR